MLISNISHYKLYKTYNDGLKQVIQNYNVYWQQEITERMNVYKIYIISIALVIADIDYDEYTHDALAVAKNAALLFLIFKKRIKLKHLININK